ncbi:MAG: hypothetical protein Q7W16_06785, partial [Coriobacteriia bacterium]|nr:hypothetical protein [Coriobacteriia bacterium]
RDTTAYVADMVAAMESIIVQTSGVPDPTVMDEAGPLRGHVLHQLTMPAARPAASARVARAPRARLTPAATPQQPRTTPAVCPHERRSRPAAGPHNAAPTPQ